MALSAQNTTDDHIHEDQITVAWVKHWWNRLLPAMVSEESILTQNLCAAAETLPSVTGAGDAPLEDTGMRPVASEGGDIPFYADREEIEEALRAQREMEAQQLAD